MEFKVQQYLKQRGQFEKPLLVGFSGGPDSLALARVLLQLGVSFHLAHFDHGWREESAKECSDLKLWAQEKNIPFFSQRAKAADLTENGAREQRLAFFKKLYALGTYEALVLAHHRQDLAETTLKRIFEGARLTKCFGILPLSHWKGMPIWRPFLKVSKKEVHEYLQSHQLQPLYDKSNEDPKYLRARLRNSIFPLLAKAFGKEIERPLTMIASQAVELADYLDERTAHLAPIEGPFGKMWDFSTAHPVEVEHCLPFGRQTLEKVKGALEENRANFRIALGIETLIVDRKKVFWLKRALPAFSKEIPLETGLLHLGDWQWKISLSKKKLPETMGWLDWWKGKVALSYEGEGGILRTAGPAFRKKWNACQVPAFLRDSLPVVCEKGVPERDFFSSNGAEKAESTLEISIIHRD